MTQGDCSLFARLHLTSQIGVLRQVAKDYQGKTIENIIQQMEARAIHGYQHKDKHIR